MMHPSLRRGRLAIAGMAALMFASACQDTPQPLAPEPPVEAPVVAALDPAQAALLAVALDDVLTRLLPASGDWQVPLRRSLGELAAALPVADAATLGRRLSAARVSAASLALDPADADALLLALAAVDHALDPDRGR